MVERSEWEYTYRWADGLDVDALEARDQALEDHMRSFGGDTCSVDFDFPYRWDQILSASSPSEQIQLLEHNMSALEAAVTSSGGCTLEFPFRWSQFWEALLAGESWAVGIAEENDRAIEFRFGRCTCEEFGFCVEYDEQVGADAVSTFTSDSYTYAAGTGAVITTISASGNNSSGETWDFKVYLNAVLQHTLLIPTGVFSESDAVSIPAADGDILVVVVTPTDGAIGSSAGFLLSMSSVCHTADQDTFNATRGWTLS